MIFEILLPRADLRGGYVVLLGYLLNALFALECFSGDAGFELGSEVSSLSFHMSDFGVICPSQTSQSFNKLLAPFCGATSNLSPATLYNWQRKYGDMDVQEARKHKAIEEENARMKRIIADQAMQIDILKEINSKKW